MFVTPGAEAIHVQRERRRRHSAAERHGECRH